MSRQEIIDSHTHVDKVGWFDPPETIIRLLDEAKVDRAIIMTYVDAPGRTSDALEYIAESCARYPDRLIGYARMNPGYGQQAIDMFEHAIRHYGMKGLKLHPVSYLQHPASPQTVAIVQKAAELNTPVLFHCGDEELSLPLQIARLAELVPDARIILGHCGGYFHTKDAIRVAQRHANIYLETSAMPYPAMIRQAVESIGAHRVLYASDGPGCDPTIEVRKVRLAGLSPDEEHQLFFENIDSLLRLAGRKEAQP
ncbi:MAG: hypothetical protein JWN15_4066 [Firmicutes bacterium]|nr:hypothetical protein [Bacillota bacterium]